MRDSIAKPRSWESAAFGRGGGIDEGFCHKLRSEVGFHAQGYSSSSSSSSFAGRTVLAEKNVSWETNFMVFEFVM